MRSMAPLIIVLLSAWLLAICFGAECDNTQQIHRYWNPSGTDHFYTANWAELGDGTAHTAWTYEGVGFALDTEPAAGNTALYRYWRADVTDHFYTTSADEIGTTTAGTVGNHGYVSEGVAGYCYAEPTAVAGLIPLYRYWQGSSSDHFYTTNADEIGTTTAGVTGNYDYVSEGIQCYVYPADFDSLSGCGPPATTTASIECDNTQPIHRYWNPTGADHFYTANWAELGDGASGWTYEGVGFALDKGTAAGNTALYRYWRADVTDHFYTTNADEIGTTTAGSVGNYGYVSEGVAGYCYADPTAVDGLIPLYRYWQGLSSDHFYTTNADEIGTTTAGVTGNYGYVSEGIQCYVYPADFNSGCGSGATTTASTTQYAECRPQDSNCHIQFFGGVGVPTCNSAWGFVTACDQPLTAHCYLNCNRTGEAASAPVMIPINMLSIAVVVTMVLLAVNVTLICAQQCNKNQGKGKYRAVQFAALSEDEERAQLQMQV